MNVFCGSDFDQILPCKLKGLWPHVEAEATTASVKTKMEEIILNSEQQIEKEEMAVTRKRYKWKLTIS